jgi:hypothetical protein
MSSLFVGEAQCLVTIEEINSVGIIDGKSEEERKKRPLAANYSYGNTHLSE